MPNTVGYSFGDVVLVPLLPFTDQISSKRRPGVLFGPAGAVGEISQHAAFLVGHEIRTVQQQGWAGSVVRVEAERT